MMNLPKITSLEDAAIDIVVSVINKAKETLGERQTLTELAYSRNLLVSKAKVVLTSLKSPLVSTSERLINCAIRYTWRLDQTFLYHIQYKGTSVDECAQYHYFEVIFSQPSAIYPIPQVTTSVFFRVQDKHVEPLELQGLPTKSCHQRHLTLPGQFFVLQNAFPNDPKRNTCPDTCVSTFVRCEDFETDAVVIIKERGIQRLIGMIFRVEGHRQEHDVRHVLLTADRILAVMMMKRKFFQRIEELGFF